MRAAGPGTIVDLEALHHGPLARDERDDRDGKRADRAGAQQAGRIDRTLEAAASGAEADLRVRDGLAGCVDKLRAQLDRIARRRRFAARG